MPRFMLGNVRHQVDDKNRFRIPAKFREGVGLLPYILPGRNGCLYIIPEEKFESVHKSLTGNDDLYRNDDMNDFSTCILANSDNLKEDNQGRLSITKDLLNVINVQKDIIFIGKVTYVEMWASEVFDARFGVLNTETLAKMLEKFKKMGV